MAFGRASLSSLQFDATPCLLALALERAHDAVEAIIPLGNPFICLSRAFWSTDAKSAAGGRGGDIEQSTGRREQY